MLNIYGSDVILEIPVNVRNLSFITSHGTNKLQLTVFVIFSKMDIILNEGINYYLFMCPLFKLIVFKFKNAKPRIF